MRRIVAATNEHLAMLCSKVEYIPSVQGMRGITLLADEEPVLVVGYDNWTDGSATMHQWCAHPRYFGRDILREAFRYIFGQCDKHVAIGVVRSDNPRALEVDLKIGFKPVAVINDAYGPGVNMHILQLRRDECRWYRS